MPRYYRESSPEMIIYKAIGDKPTGEVTWSGEERYPRASVEVDRSRFTPNFYPAHGGLHPVEYYDPPDTLWTYHPATISAAFSHSTTRHTIPVMLSMAKQEYPDLSAPYDLSKHSSRLARKGIEMGLIRGHESNPSAAVTNNIDFDDYGNTVSADMLRSSYYEPHRMSDTDVNEARANLRDMIRPRKEHWNVMDSPQFDHPQLPGVDW